MNAYFLSGLGADKRLFAKLKLPESINIIHIEWIDPLKNETLGDYAKRLAVKIDTTKPFVLVGLSFGGIMAVEISGFMKPEQIILLSSTATFKQLPWYYRLAGKLRLHRLVHPQLLKTANPLFYWLFGTADHAHKKLLKQVLIDTDSRFLTWAISCILKWDHAVKPENMYHIHGSADKVLPIKFVQPDAVVNGGHLIVYMQHEEVSALLERVING